MGLESQMVERSLFFMAAALRGAVALENDMIKNFAYTIPTVGRITIGEKRDKDGKRLPVKLNHFQITAQHQREGRFVQHPVQEVVAGETGQAPDKLQWIPIKLMFNDPDLSVRERYEAFGADGRMLCAGDGEIARRKQGATVEEVKCPGADHCEYGKQARCKLMTRLNVQIDVPKSEKFTPDPLSSFILRSAGFNTARTIRAKLTALAAMLGGKLTGVPLQMRLRQKSSTGSCHSIFYYVDIVPATDLISCAQLAKKYAEDMANAGLNQQAFEEVIKAGLANGPFEDTSEDFLEAAEYLEIDSEGTPGEDAGEGNEAAVQRGRMAATNPAEAFAVGEMNANPLDWVGAVKEQLGALEHLAH